MRIVDMSGTAAGPEAEIVVSEGAELLLATSVVLGDPDEGFDLSSARLDALRDLASEELKRDFKHLTSSESKQMLSLISLSLEAGAPHDVAGLVSAMEAAEPSEISRILLWGESAGVSRDVTLAAVAGDEDARRLLLDAHRKNETDMCECEEVILDLGPDKVKELALSVVQRFRDEVWGDLAAEAMAAIERDAADRRALLGAEPTLSAIERITNGFRLTPEPGVERVVLIPSYVFRPWLLTFESDADTAVLAYPVADDSIELDPDEPSPQLLRLVKALGDEGRLRLVRRLGEGELTLAEAAGAMGVSKPTAHHHLSLLRQAGLISVEARGREKCYSLRTEPAGYAEQLLGRYLG